jgi:branched-chain amino acid transport system ATP-binding protein
VTGLVVSGLAKAFGGLGVFDGVGFRLTPGRVTGLIGPNGAGKSTLINCLTGVLPVDRGEVRLDGRLVTGRPADVLCRAGLTRTFQHARLLDDRTVLANVLIGAHRRGRASLLDAALRLPAFRRDERALRGHALDALDRVGCAALGGLPARALTAGQQRLVSVARALAGGPRLLLLDEPAAGLDATEIRTLIQALRDIAAGGVGLLIVEHHLDLVMDLCEQVLVLAGGRLVAAGPPETVRADPDVIDAYLGTSA